MACAIVGDSTVSEQACLSLPQVAVSVVSHGQGDLVVPLLQQLIALRAQLPLEIVLTENMPTCRTALPIGSENYVRVLYNERPLGFGTNHNRAFRLTKAPYFCVLNPDIRLNDNSLARLLERVAACPGVAGPRVVGSDGMLQDSARKIPGLIRLAWRKATGRRHADYDSEIPVQNVDWVAGMCLMFDRDTFVRVGGFTENYQLYCEDVDICLKIHLIDRAVSWVQGSTVIHDAQRDSHRSLRYLGWHLESICRLLTSRPYWKYRLRLQG